MAKKKLEKKSTEVWACEKGCDLSKRACSHLEELMPKYNRRGDKFMSALKDISQIPARDKEESIFLKRDKFIKLLKSYSIEPYMIDVLVGKFVYNWSESDIAREYGFVRDADVNRIFHRALEALKERGLDHDR